MKLRIKVLREQLGWDQATLSLVSLVGVPRISGLENGRLRPPENGVELARLKVALAWVGKPIELLDPVDGEPVEKAAFGLAFDPALARAIRRAAGVSQSRLASELGVTRVAVARWESGTRQPRCTTRRRYLEILSLLQREVQSYAPEAIENEVQMATQRPDEETSLVQAALLIDKLPINDRDRLILERRVAGLTFRAIGDELGISRARVQQVYMRTLARLGCCSNVRRKAEALIHAAEAIQRCPWTITRKGEAEDAA